MLCVHRAVTVQVRIWRTWSAGDQEDRHRQPGICSLRSGRQAGARACRALDDPAIQDRPGTSVRQALIYAQNGDAEAALVSRAQAAGPEVLTVDIDPALYDPLIQAMESSPRQASAIERRPSRVRAGTGRAADSPGSGFEKPAIARPDDRHAREATAAP